jgi:hypothetical protein
MFDQQARARLRDKLDYERWVLNELEDEHDVFPDELNDTVIKGDDLTIHAEVSASLSISQGHVDEVIEPLYPLIFAASYKSLDMIIEWILEENRETYEHQWNYSDKHSDSCEMFYTEELQLPEPLNGHEDIFERLLYLYGDLMDHRHAVVHRHEFNVEGSTFRVEDEDNVRYEFDTAQLFSLAKVGTLLADIILNENLSENEERGIKWHLDNLNFIHGQDTYDIAPPWAQTIEYRAEAIAVEPYRWEITMDAVQRADSSSPETEGYFLRIVGNHEGDTVSEWIIPSEAVPDRDTLELEGDSSEFEEYQLGAS